MKQMGKRLYTHRNINRNRKKIIQLNHFFTVKSYQVEKKALSNILIFLLLILSIVWNQYFLSLSFSFVYFGCALQSIFPSVGMPPFVIILKCFMEKQKQKHTMIPPHEVLNVSRQKNYFSICKTQIKSNSLVEHDLGKPSGILFPM